MAQAKLEIRATADTSQATRALKDLSIQGVKASFVIFPSGGQINVSARSLGEVTVQLIMEALGGGGHLTMAATQLTGVGIEESRKLLKEAIRNVMDRALPARDS